MGRQGVNLSLMIRESALLESKVCIPHMWCVLTWSCKFQCGGYSLIYKNSWEYSGCIALARNFERLLSLLICVLPLFSRYFSCLPHAWLFWPVHLMVRPSIVVSTATTRFNRLLTCALTLCTVWWSAWKIRLKRGLFASMITGSMCRRSTIARTTFSVASFLRVWSGAKHCPSLVSCFYQCECNEYLAICTVTFSAVSETELGNDRSE